MTDHPAYGVTQKMWEDFARQLGQFTLDQIKQATEPLKQRIAELERRQQGFKYVGVWTIGTKYSEGNFVTDQGSLWHCNRDSTSERPATGGAWTLCVKKGKDGKRRRAADGSLADRHEVERFASFSPANLAGSVSPRLKPAIFLKGRDHDARRMFRKDRCGSRGKARRVCRDDAPRPRSIRRRN